MAESEKQKVTLYDFLYIDRERIKSFYAQLFNGLQTAVQQVESSSTHESDEFKVGPASVASLASQNSKTVSEGRMENVDPHDLVLRDVLQGLAEEGIINDIDSAEAGSLVLVNGTVTIFDMKVVTPYFDIYKDLVDGGSHPAPEWIGKNKQAKTKAFVMIKKLLESMPLGLQVIVSLSKGPAMWGTLNSEYLRESAGNLLLKHGHTLNGTWHMLAIVDIPGTMVRPRLTGIPDLINGLITAGTQVVELLGRPKDSAGVTPLLIFRKLP